MSKISKFTKYCGLVILILISIESMFYYYFSKKTDRLSFSNPEFYVFSQDQILQLAKIYNKNLGWLYNNKTELGERNRGELAKSKRVPYYALAFGDSFTFGTEVSDKDTWPYKLEEISHAPVLNFGMPGYGIDQIYWMFEEKSARLNSKYVIFGFISDDIRRAQTNFWRFNYHLKNAIPTLTKPVYVRDESGFKLMPNPVQSIEELPNLLDTAFISKLMETDPVRGKNRNPSFSFPYSRLIFNEVILSELMSDPLETVWKNSENQELLKFILSHFSSSAAARKNIPIVVLFPDFSLVNAYSKDKPSVQMASNTFFRICEELNLKCLLPLEIFKEKKQTDSYFLAGGHYNAETNQEIAKAVQEFIVKTEAGGAAAADASVKSLAQPGK